MTAIVSQAGVEAAMAAIPDACRIGRVVAVAGDEPRVRFA
jgi:hypothetical protein